MKFPLIYLFIFIFGCASGPKLVQFAPDGFPDAWWQPIPEDQISDWEIPPQKARRTENEVVLSKRTELGQFSNLHPIEFEFEGAYYGSVEGLWQALKYPESKTDERLKNPDIVWPFSRAQVMRLSGFEAKRAGDIASQNMKKLGIKWVTYKGKKLNYSNSTENTDEHYALILRACRKKLETDPKLARLLRSTKNLVFLSDHKQKPDSPPAYRYHEIYMKLRAEQKSLSQIDSQP